MVQKSDRLPHIALLQILGIILVIVGHILAPYLHSWYGYKFITNIPVRGLHHYIYSFHIPLFFFISGYLFAYKKHDEKILYKEIKLRFKRLIFPFCIAGIFLYMPTEIFIAPLDRTINDFPRVFIRFFTFGHCSYLWFLASLFIDLVIYATILKTPLKRHLIILTLIILYIEHYHPSLSLSWIIYDKPLDMLIFVHMGYMVAKYCQYDDTSVLSKPQIKGNFFSKLYFFMICLFIVKTLSDDFLLKIRFVLDPIWKLAILYTLASILSAILPKLRYFKPIEYVSKNMMGIYLMQDPLLVSYRRIISGNIAISPTYSILVITPLILLTAYVIIESYKKVSEKIKKIISLNSTGTESEIKVAVKTNT